MKPLDGPLNYDAFGTEPPSTHPTTNPWRFSSKRHDPETGLIYFGRRYYDPTLGKWLTQDPLGLKAGPNLYAYVVNNPMTNFDLYGLLAVEFERMNQLNGSSGYRNDASGYSRSDRSSSDHRESTQTSTSQRSFPFLPSNDNHHYVNRSFLGEMWDFVKEKAPGIAYEALDAADKVSYAAMLIPTSATVLAGVGLKTLSISGKALLNLMRSAPINSAIRTTTKYLIHTNLLTKQSASITNSLAKTGLQSAHAQEFVNLASAKRTHHIIYGEGLGQGGHLWPAQQGKTPFPASWGPDKIMHHASDIATDPNISWTPTDRLGIQRHVAEGTRESIKIRVVIESGGNDIVTTYPIP